LGGSSLIRIQPGDILLWRIDSSASWIERLIGWGERHTGQPSPNGVDYYHAGIVGPDALHYYDSAPGGIKNRLVTDPWPDHLEVYRFKIPLNPDQLKAMWSYANSQLGVGYNYFGVLTAGWLQIDGKPFCSEFVWRLCTYAGVVVCPWQTCLSPDDIAFAGTLERIGDVPPPKEASK